MSLCQNQSQVKIVVPACIYLYLYFAAANMLQGEYLYLIYTINAILPLSRNQDKANQQA